MIRRWLLPLVLLGMLATLTPPTFSVYELTGEEELDGQLAGIVHWLYSAIRPQPDLAPTADIEHVDVPIFGVNTFLQTEALPAVREEAMKLASEAGFRFVRQQFVWEDIEIHGKNDFEDRRNDLTGDGVPDPVDAWAKYDQIVDLSLQYEIELIARIGNPPAWTRVMTNTVGTKAPPDDFNDYADFVGAVVARYEGRINYIQLWNEPNIYDEWGEQDANPEAYTEMLCLAYQRAKSINPDIVVLAAAMSPTIQMGGRNMNDLIYLQRMYNAGAGDCFDILSAQGYGLFSGPPDLRLRPTVINYPHNLLLRDVMVQNGDKTKPIWISEMGWNVVPDGIPAVFGQVTEAQQARYAVEAYQRAQRDWPWVGVANYWFLKQATDQEINQPVYYFRLLEPNFTRLPAYEAIKGYANSAEAENPGAFSLASYQWGQVRPYLFLILAGLALVLLLEKLTPREDEDVL